MKWIAAALFGAALVCLPAFAGDFYINLATQILIASVFALSLNLLVGFGGMTSLGPASFLGVAAYLSALPPPAMASRMGPPRSSRSPAPPRRRPFSESLRCAQPASAFS
jgi:ABC-type branched-subunit amino acid transport system permease subunit